MNPMFKVFVSHCWNNMYLIVGICMGLSLSLLLIPMDMSEYQTPAVPSAYSASEIEEIDEYEPKINTDARPQQAQKIPKAIVRPRYYSTELGMKEKLFVGILTSPEYLHSRDVALNKTIAHLVDKIRYFISIPEGTKPNVSLPGIVGFTDTKSILKPFHALKYIIDNYLEDYDYYFLIKDVTYINARLLVEFVTKLSVSQNVHMGIPSEIPSYCSFDSGILLSNSLIQELKNNLDWCVKNTYSDMDDINFGRCIMHSTSIPCSTNLQGQTFTSTNLKTMFDFEQDFSKIITQKEFEKSLTVYPVYDHQTIYKINIYFSTMKLIEVQQKINDLRKEIEKSAYLCPLNQRNISWPIGNQPGNKAAGRFDILRWTYFNETHTFLETDFSSIKELKADAKFDIDRIVHSSVNRILETYDHNLKFKTLLNGYRKFDASRGMDYILDLLFTEKNTGKEVSKRIEVCKPLGKVEILPVPYVTENTRINMILVIDLSNKEEAINVLEHYTQECMQKKQKTFLMIVLLYDPDSPSKGHDDVFYDIKKYALSLTDKYKKDQSKITWLSIRLPNAISSIKSDPMLRIAITDLSTRKFAADSLILFIETGTDLKVDYLNRVRMNTISQFQVFSPMPFVEFHPDIAYADETKHVELDINHNYGKYDEYNYNNIGFYVKDYNMMRKTVESSIPIARTDKDISALLKLSRYNSVTSLFEMFLSFTDLHGLRAVEPALKLKYREIDCAGIRYNSTYRLCVKRKNLHLGRRGQLAKLILDYQNFQSNLL